MPCTYGPPRGVSHRFERLMSRVAAWILLSLLCIAAAHAASIGVSPTLIEVDARASASGLRVTNGDAAQPVSVQARIVRWRQDDTGDVYTPADGVVASPPVTRIAPGGENLIRIVRTAAHPVAGEESYRLLVDELPEPGAQQVGAVTLLIRHSVPVFFATAGAAPAQPQWHIARAEQDHEGGNTRGWRVTVENRGDKRLRLANLDMYDASGALVAQSPGLVGYVLGRARMEFFVAQVLDQAGAPARASAHSATALRLSAQSEAGPIETGLLPVVSP